MPRTDVSAFVAEAAEDVPDRQALVESGGRTLTWAGLEDEVARIATGLGAHGVRAGQRVMILVGNRIEFVTMEIDYGSKEFLNFLLILEERMQSGTAALRKGASRVAPAGAAGD